MFCVEGGDKEERTASCCSFFRHCLGLSTFLGWLSIIIIITCNALAWLVRAQCTLAENPSVAWTRYLHPAHCQNLVVFYPRFSLISSAFCLAFCLLSYFTTFFMLVFYGNAEASKASLWSISITSSLTESTCTRNMVRLESLCYLAVKYFLKCSFSDFSGTEHLHI